jgi:hypothetical protein
MLKMMRAIPAITPILFIPTVAFLLFFDLEPMITITTPNAKRHMAVSSLSKRLNRRIAITKYTVAGISEYAT